MKRKGIASGLIILLLVGGLLVISQYPFGTTGRPCSTDSDCYSGEYCYNGWCYTCKVEGDYCTENKQCCSDSCESNVCTEGGCEPNGAYCGVYYDDWASCCSGFCGNYECADRTTTTTKTTTTTSDDLCSIDADCCSGTSMRYADCYYSEGAGRNQCRYNTINPGGYYDCTGVIDCSKYDNTCVDTNTRQFNCKQSGSFCDCQTETCEGGCQDGKCLKPCIEDWQPCSPLLQLLGQEKCCALNGECKISDWWNLLWGTSAVCDPSDRTECEVWCQECLDGEGSCQGNSMSETQLCCRMVELCGKCSFCEGYECPTGEVCEWDGNTYEEGDFVAKDCASGWVAICRQGKIVTIHRQANEDLFCEHCPDVCEDGCQIQAQPCNPLNPCCDITDEAGNKLICEPPLDGVCQFEDIYCKAEGKVCDPTEDVEIGGTVWDGRCCPPLRCREKVGGLWHTCQEYEPSDLEKLLEDYPWLMIVVPAVIGYFYPKSKEKKKKGLIIGAIVGGIIYYLYQLPEWIKLLGGLGIVGGLAIFFYLGGGALIMYFISKKLRK